LVNDPDFKPRARFAEKIDFDQMRERCSHVYFTFPHYLTDNECRVWFLKKPEPEVR
jgi:hypothetical protein